MDTLKRFEDKINKIIKTYEDKVESYSKRISNLEAVVNQADAAMAAATDSLDVDGYKKAKRDKNDAVDELEMLKTKLERFQSDSMISYSDYQALREDIVSEYNRNLESYKKKFAPMIREIKAAGESAGKFDQRVDDMLVTLQRKVMKISSDPHAEVAESWQKAVTNDRIDSHPVVWFAANVIDSADDNCLLD